jgi:hypothetical protein
MEGQVLDRNGQPVPDVPVAVVATRSGIIIPFVIFFPRVETSISEQVTDANGRFQLLFPEPINQNDIVLTINRPTSNDPAISGYNSRSWYNISASDFSRNQISFGQIHLFDPAESTLLTILVKNTNALSARGIRLRFDGLTLYQDEDYKKEISLHVFPQLQQEVIVAKQQVAVIYYEVLGINDQVVAADARIVVIEDSPLTIEIEI